MKKLSTRTVQELKMIAKEKGIKVDGLKKAQIVEALETEGNNVITSVKPSGIPSDPSATSNAQGVLISPQPAKVQTVPKPEPKPEEDETKVALYVSRNLAWNGVGKLSQGFNFVSREVADKWLTLRAVREASPEEVASHYGIN